MGKRVLLCILDGWGISPEHEYNAIYKANTPNYDNFVKTQSFTQINADSLSVGLPEGQMGNSEVGHLNIGAGRIVYQELTRINKAIKDGDFFENTEFLNAINHAQKNNSALHIIGLCSNGGVHSSIEHLEALIDLVKKHNFGHVYIHAFLDGRDTPPKSAEIYLRQIENKLAAANLPQIASIMGRYWVMDRDKRWERVEKGYDCLVSGIGKKAENSIEALRNSYADNKTDEFVEPAVTSKEGEGRIQDNDAVIFFNYRPDRAREITAAIAVPEFECFERKKTLENLYYVCMTQYDETFPLPAAYSPQKLTNILGDVLDEHGIHQFRTAETEKYAHITFFFNGGEETPNKLETRCLVDSPKVATYDLQPEMSAPAVCEKVLEALDNEEYGFILVNFANPDMVGHTGIMCAAIKACETVDECIGKIAEKALEKGVDMIITADHGNAEWMYNEKTCEPQTAHTTNPVPFIIVSDKHYKLRETGALSDIAPSILKLLDIPQPKEMTGTSMVK